MEHIRRELVPEVFSCKIILGVWNEMSACGHNCDLDPQGEDGWNPKEGAKDFEDEDKPEVIDDRNDGSSKKHVCYVSQSAETLLIYVSPLL